MKQEISIIDNRVVITLMGSMYVEEASVLRKNLIGYIDKGHTRFLINLSSVDYIDSSGLGVLVGIHKRALERGGSVTISGLQGTVKQLFELTRLTRVFDIK